MRNEMLSNVYVLCDAALGDEVRRSYFGVKQSCQHVIKNTSIVNSTSSRFGFLDLSEVLLLCFQTKYLVLWGKTFLFTLVGIRVIVRFGAASSILTSPVRLSIAGSILAEKSYPRFPIFILEPFFHLWLVFFRAKVFCFVKNPS